MTITVSWDNEAHTTILFAVHRKCEWEAFWAAVQQTHALMCEPPHTVDLIVSAALGALPGSGALLHFKRIYSEAPANHGLTIVVGAGFFHKMLVSTFSKVYLNLGDLVRVADSVDEARAILADRRQARQETRRETRREMRREMRRETTTRLLAVDDQD